MAKLPNRTDFPKPEPGIALVEVLIGLSILGMVILVLVNLPSAISLISGSNRESIAREVVAKQVESLRTQTYTSLTNGSSVISDPRLYSLPGVSSQVLIEDCQPPVCNNAERTKKVTVSVSWQESGKQKQLTVVSLISEGGLL